MVSETPGTWSFLGTVSAFNPQNQPIVKELINIKGREIWMVTHVCTHSHAYTYKSDCFVLTIQSQASISQCFLIKHLTLAFIHVRSEDQEHCEL